MASNIFTAKFEKLLLRNSNLREINFYLSKLKQHLSKLNNIDHCAKKVKKMVSIFI